MNNTFLLAALNGGSGSLQENMKSESGWYTVFVNEYTYEPMYTGQDGYADETGDIDGRPSWMAYVNQNPRRFYIRVTQEVSPDGNSLYARSKYGVSQQSLMTYYSQTNVAGDGTAIGVERFNETEGLNVRFPTTNGVQGGSSSSNGRWNVAQYLNGNMTAETNLSINRNNANQRPSWDLYVNMTDPIYFPEVDEERLEGGPAIKGGYGTIPGLAQETYDANTVFTDPQTDSRYTINAINACMSRNRDNNGNGRIEPDELRWFVPAMDQYLQMVIGKNALPEPMMDYAKITGLPQVNNENYEYVTGYVDNGGYIYNEFYPRYLFVSSNRAANGSNNVMWGMEGTSTSSWDNVHGWSQSKSNPWSVRCMRVLNADLRTVQKEDRATPPYHHDEANRIFRMDYVNLASIRTTSYTGNGTGSQQMPIHNISSSYNSVYKAFEYAANDVIVPADYRYSETQRPYLFDNVISPYFYSNDEGPCSNLSGTGWRVPNQIELTMMRNAGVFTTGNNTYWLSCTVNYFQYANGSGSLTSTSDRFFLSVLAGSGTMMTQKNYREAGSIRVRCVRDIE